MVRSSTLCSSRRLIAALSIGLLTLFLIQSCGERACVECEVSSADRTSSEILTGHSNWVRVIEDADDPWIGDITAVYMRTTSSALEFRIEVDSLCDICWSNVCLCVLLDTDQNRETGWNSSSSSDVAPNDIGADFLVLTACEYGSFHRWLAPQCQFSPPSGAEITHVVLVNPHVIEVGVILGAIGDPAAVDVVLTCDPDYLPHVCDYVPDQDQGHITYNLRHLFHRRLQNI